MCCEEGRLLQNKTVISLLIEFLFNLIWYSFQHDIMLVLVCSLPAEGDWALHILRIMFQNSSFRTYHTPLFSLLLVLHKSIRSSGGAKRRTFSRLIASETFEIETAYTNKQTFT
mmetsp:Transcript_2114/g.4043  ORF Transcript_2114/g.4043 Transcript_2114/m.4043 type:complete len:114 (+) Transcript_2114:287-628(+)